MLGRASGQGVPGSRVVALAPALTASGSILPDEEAAVSLSELFDIGFPCGNQRKDSLSSLESSYRPCNHGRPEPEPQTAQLRLDTERCRLRRTSQARRPKFADSFGGGTRP